MVLLTTEEQKIEFLKRLFEVMFNQLLQYLIKQRCNKNLIYCFVLMILLKKIIVVKDTPGPWYTEDGILVISIYDFLLNKNSLDM